MAADRGRDLQFRVLSDLSDLDLDAGARQLDDLGDAGKQAGDKLGDSFDAARRQLDDLGDKTAGVGRQIADDVEPATRGVDDLGDKATSTARRVDKAFEDIARSSRSNVRKVDDDVDHAKKGLDDFKEEAGSSGREAAASFSGGFDDITSLVQETAANALGGFGPLGAAAGIAAAAGIGILTASIQKSKERVTELTESFLSLRREGIDPAADSAQHMADELDAADLAKFKKQADELGISYSVLREAFDGNSDAIAAVRAAMKAYNDENATGNPYTGQQADLHADLTQKLNETEEAYRNSADAAAFLGGKLAETSKATEEAAAAVEAHAAALDGFVDPVSVYTDTLATKEEKERASAQSTADATESQKDSWEDYAKKVDVSVDEYLDALERQVKAQEDWADNLQTLAQRGVEDGVLAELERMGPEGAPLVAKLTTASDAELQRMVRLYGRQGKAAGEAVAQNLVDQAGAVGDAAAALHSGAARQLSGRINIPIGYERRFTLTDLQRLRYDIQNEVGTIVIPIKAGQNAYTNNANNSRYRY